MSFSRLLRSFIALFTALSLVACTSMQARQVGPVAPLTAELKVGDEVQIKATNGKTYLLTLTEVSKDQLVGTGENKKVTISRQQIETLEVRKFSPVKTAAASIGTVAGVVLVAAAVAMVMFANALEDIGKDH